MLEAVSMRFLIALLTRASSWDRLCKSKSCQAPHVSTLSLLRALFLTSALFLQRRAKLLRFFTSLLSFFPRIPEGREEQLLVSLGAWLRPAALPSTCLSPLPFSLSLRPPSPEVSQVQASCPSFSVTLHSEPHLLPGSATVCIS